MEDKSGNNYTIVAVFAIIGIFIGAWVDMKFQLNFPMFLLGGAIGMLIGLPITALKDKNSNGQKNSFPDKE